MMDSLNTDLPRIFIPDEINNNIRDYKNSSLLLHSNRAMSPKKPAYQSFNGASNQTNTPRCRISWPLEAIDNDCSTLRSEAATADVRVFRDGSSRLAQMKANTKMKRIRKPYQLVPHSRAGLKSGSNDNSSIGSCCASMSNRVGLRSATVTHLHSCRTPSIAPATMFFDDWSFRQKTPSSSDTGKNLNRTRSCEDLKRLAQTTTVSFSLDRHREPSTTPTNNRHALLTEPNAAIDDVSSILSNLRVVDPM